MVSAEGVAPAPLLVSASPTPLQPASSTVVVVATRSNKAIVRSMGILSPWPAHSLPWPAQRTLAGMEINDADRMPMAYDNGMQKSSMRTTFPPAFAPLCQKSPILPPMSSEDDTSSPLGEAIGSPMATK